MAATEFDTLIPEHPFANIGNETVRWDDGWFSDTVHARRFKGEIVEVDTLSPGAIRFGDGDVLYLGDLDDSGIWYDGSDLNIDPALVGSGSLVVNGILETTNNIVAESETGALAIQADRYGAHQYGPLFMLRKSRGTSGTPVGINDGDDLGRISCQGMQDTAAWPTWTAHDDAIRMLAVGAHTTSNHGRELAFRTIPENSTSSIEALSIRDNGDIALPGDNRELLLGASDDAGIWYDGSHMYINPQLVGSGEVRIPAGKLGIGDIGAAANGAIDVSYETVETATSAIGIYSTVFYGEAGSGNTTKTIYGGYLNAQTTAAYDGDISALQGFRNVSIHKGSGTCTNMYGAGFRVYADDSCGAITNFYGCHIYIDAHASAGVVTNMYGLYLEDVADGATLNYSIYSNGGFSYFKDNVGINVLIPNQLLHVGGNIKVDDNNKLVVGTGNDGLIYYDGSDMIIDPDFVGSGELVVGGGIQTPNWIGIGNESGSDRIPINNVFNYDGNSASVYGIRTLMQYGSGGSGNMAQPIYADYVDAGTHSSYDGTFSSIMYGFNATINHRGGTISGGATGAVGQVILRDGAGSITTAKCLQAYALNQSTGNSVITNLYGLYVNDMDFGDTLSYSIYTNLGTCHFGDDVEIDGPVAIGGAAGGSAYQHDILFDTDITASSPVASRAILRYGSAGSGAMSNALYGLNFLAETDSTYNGNLSATIYGIRGYAKHNGTGTCTSLCGVAADTVIAGSSGNVTNMYGVLVTTDDTSTGTATNVYGVYVNSVTDGGTLNYAIYTNDGPCRFGDDVKVEGELEVSTTTGGFIVPRMTTTQRGALTAVDGMIVYDTDLNAFYFRENGSWVTK